MTPEELSEKIRLDRIDAQREGHACGARFVSDEIEEAYASGFCAGFCKAKEIAKGIALHDGYGGDKEIADRIAKMEAKL